MIYQQLSSFRIATCPRSVGWLAALGLVVALLGAPWTRAGGPPNLRGNTYQPFSGQVIVNLKLTTPNEHWVTLGGVNIKSALNGVWAQQRGTLANVLKQELGKSRRWNGQSAYNIDVSLAERGELLAKAFGGIGLRYILRGNRVAFTMTTPTIFGSYADPRFVIDFDLFLTVDLQVSLDRPVTVTSATVEASVSDIRGDNLIGELVKAAAGIQHFLGGPDYLGQVRSRINGMPVNLTGQFKGLLAGVKPQVARLRLPNLTLRTSLDEKGVLHLLLAQEPPVILH